MLCNPRFSSHQQEHTGTFLHFKQVWFVGIKLHSMQVVMFGVLAGVLLFPPLQAFSTTTSLIFLVPFPYLLLLLGCNLNHRDTPRHRASFFLYDHIAMSSTLLFLHRHKSSFQSLNFFFVRLQLLKQCVSGFFFILDKRFSL
jgi:hypothetical protein